MTAYAFDRSRVAFFRESKGWSVARLAAEIDCGSASIRNIEAGRSMPSLRVALRLADVFDVKLEALLKVTEPEPAA